MSAARSAGFTGTRIRNILTAVLVPLALVLVYFAGLGGSAARGGALPVLIVNHDEMVEQVNNDGTTTKVVAGRLLVSWLTSPEHTGRYHWELVSAETAEQRLSAGTAYAAVEIPDDFSAAVVSLNGGDPHPAQIRVTTAQGSDFATGALTEDLFDGLTAQFGQELTNRVGVSLADGLNESAAGLQDAANGAQRLADGAGELKVGFGQYVDGAEQLADGSGQLADGSAQLADGTAELANGSGQLADGASQLAGGLSEFNGGLGRYVDGAGAYVAGVTQFTDGAGQFAGGVQQYTAGVRQYTDGVGDYVSGVQQLADGLAQLDSATPQLQQAAGKLQQVADELANHEATFAEVQRVLESLRADLDGIESIDPIQLIDYCDELGTYNPQRAEACRASVRDLSDRFNNAGITIENIRAGLDDLIAKFGDLQSAGGQLAALADGITQYTGGVSQANGGAAQLAAAGQQLRDGGTTLTTGGDDLNAAAQQVRDGAGQLADAGAQLQGAGGQLIDGSSQLAAGAGDLSAGVTTLSDSTAQLASGAGELNDGLHRLHDGQIALAQNGAPLADGVEQLRSGAGTMASSLQQGADQAKHAIADPDGFADTLARPVVSEIVPLQQPTFVGVLAALLLPVGVWISGMIASLRRGVVTNEALDSSATNWSILLAATRRLWQPVFLVAGATGLLQHLVFGVPWQGIGITLLFAVLAALVTITIHLLLATRMTRRNAAIVSLTLLAVQLLLARGFVPLELRAGWLAALSGFAPLQQVAAGMQAGYAGAGVGSVVGPALILLLMIVGAAAVAIVLVGGRRRRRANDVLATMTAAQS